MQARPKFPQLVEVQPAFSTQERVFYPQNSTDSPTMVLNLPTMDDHWDSGTLVNFFFGLEGKEKEQADVSWCLEKMGWNLFAVLVALFAMILAQQP